MTAKPETNVIVLEQAPIIRYDIVEQKGKEIEERIASLNLEAIEPNEANLKLMKSTRAELGREFKTFEEQRKMVKDLIMMPYLEFEAKYKEFIAEKFKTADALLKEKIATVDDAILKEKIERIKAYFDERNTYDFIDFDDLDLKILKSKSDKSYKDQIDEYLEQVARDLETIEGLEHKDRVLAKYQITKDLSRAIADTNIEIQREEAIRKQKEEAEARRKAQEEARQKAIKEAEAKRIQEERDYVEKVATQVAESTEPTKPKLYRASFTVTATTEQIKALKEFMNKEGINYESK